MIITNDNNYFMNECPNPEHTNIYQFCKSIKHNCTYNLDARFYLKYFIINYSFIYIVTVILTNQLYPYLYKISTLVKSYIVSSYNKATNTEHKATNNEAIT